jgi:hypothetical protein
MWHTVGNCGTCETTVRALASRILTGSQTQPIETGTCATWLPHPWLRRSEQGVNIRHASATRGGHPKCDARTGEPAGGLPALGQNPPTSVSRAF